MIMKKIIAWLTIAALFVCVLSACGKRSDETKPAGTSENESATTATEGSSGSDTENGTNNDTDTGTDTGADTDTDNGGTTEANADESETELGTHYDENQGEWDPD